MLFGNNPWGGRKPPTMQPPVQQPPVMQPLSQPAAQPQYATPTWAQPTPDLAYSGGLANYYAGQLQNQQSPGTVLPQTQFPVQQQPAPAPVPAPAPAPVQGPGHGPGGWRDAFHTALQSWHNLRPTFGGDAFAQWQQGRPMRQDYRQGGM